jgi:hypothetical protein
LLYKKIAAIVVVVGAPAAAAAVVCVTKTRRTRVIFFDVTQSNQKSLSRTSKYFIDC